MPCKPMPCKAVRMKRSAHEKSSARPKPAELFKKSGNTYFRTFGTIIGSLCLTTVFGKGTGVATVICSPEMVRRTCRFVAPNGCGLWLLDVEDSPSSSRVLNISGQAFVR